MHKKSNSQRLFEQMSALLPGGVNSPVRSCQGLINPPLIVERGEGACVYDVDGNKFIDYCCSWGALIHGHAHPVILAAVAERMEKGTSFGISCSVEVKIASEIVQLISSIEKLRFVSSGTEATMTAVRLARAFTGRDLIIKFSGNYHGHSDSFLVQAGSGVMNLNSSSSSSGVPDAFVSKTASLTYNDIGECRRFFKHRGKEVAAVIVEPVAGNMGVVPPAKGFLSMLREETRSAGALLIFDEVITGFRVACGGAQAYYGIRPDLTCLGKVVGGGFPAAAVGGRADIMEMLAPLGPVYQAGTLSGNPIALEAGYQSLQLLKKEGVYQELQRKTSLVTEPVAAAIDSSGVNACLQQQGSMFTIFFGRKEVRNGYDAKAIETERFGRMFRYLFERGIYLSPSPHEACFVSLVHSDEELTITANHIVDFFHSNAL